MTTLNARIPFPGFYESLYSSEIDAQQEQEVERIDDGESEYEVADECTTEDIGEILTKYANYSTMFRQIAEAYVEAFSDHLAEKTGMDIPLKFEELTSPKEYNFRTDNIYADIDLEDAKLLLVFVGKERLMKEAREMFTSRSGFISFYDPDIETWGEIETWDHNQVYCLLSCLVVTDKWNDDDMGIYYMLSDKIFNIYQNNVDWPGVSWELENFGQGLDMKFPGPGITDVGKYVKKFEELNNLVGG